MALAVGLRFGLPRPAAFSPMVLLLVAATAVIGQPLGMTPFRFALQGGQTGIIATWSGSLLWLRTGRRPEGFSFHDLEAEALRQPAIAPLVPEWAEECFEGLVDGIHAITTIESLSKVSWWKARA